MADPVLFTTHVAQGLGRLLEQFKGQPNMAGQLKSFLTQVQDVENMLITLAVERYLDTAVGEQLDGIGRVVNQLRLGQNDTDYRVSLKGRIISNRANSRIEDLYFMFSILLPASTFKLVEGTVASFTFTVDQALTGSDPAPEVISTQLQIAKGAGIHATLIYGSVPSSQRFKYASGDVIETSSTQGYANDAGTTGGKYSAAL